VHALAHVTGGGIPGNLARSLPGGRGARIETSAWETPGIFRWLQENGRVDRKEMFDVFNMGIGMIAILPQAEVDAVSRAAAEADIATWPIGEVEEGEGVEIV
jgi:phosphoribosylformylglycinamidine cyclo-ligase